MSLNQIPANNINFNLLQPASITADKIAFDTQYGSVVLQDTLDDVISRTDVVDNRISSLEQLVYELSAKIHELEKKDQIKPRVIK